MAASVSRRSVLAAGAGAAAGLSMPGVALAHETHEPHESHGRAVAFTLDATVLDGGEQVASVTLHTGRLGPIDPRSLTAGTFRVHAKATNPLPGTTIFGEYDLDRTVTGARLDRHGDIVVELSTAEGQPGGATLGYLSAGRNVRFDLTYTITQVAPLRLRHGGPVTITRFAQGELRDPEVDAYSRHVSASGLKYRLFTPRRSGRRPLIVWLHGGGEGALLSQDYYDNETQLRANRGALGFSTRQAQEIFGGAHVVAPQSTSFWLEDGPRFAPLIREVIGEVVRRHDVDTDRIHVVGCSNGGYMSLKMTTAYPRTFASSVPICGVVVGGQVPDADLAAIRTPTWLVASRDDDTVDPEANSVHAHELIPGSKLSLYDTVTWNGYRYPGHWSWIYVGRNDPSIGGTHLWQWMSRRRR
jgi:pimeloyl-ACP methyl ester carboxylesterase